MEHDVSDDLERRLRAARPHPACTDESAFDAALLARVRDQPIAARRAVPRAVAVPVAAGVTLTATAAVMLGGGPGDVGGPSSASAITQALRWLSPPPGTILHAHSVETQGTQTTTREFWQAADDPAASRLLTTGAETFETAGDALYDPATNTIYDPPAGPVDNPQAAPDDTGVAAAKKQALAVEQAAKKAPTPKATSGVGPAVRKRAERGDRGAKPGEQAIPAGDPIVAKARMLLQEGRMEVTGRVVHNGTDAWEISLKPGLGRPGWMLWVAVADGKPLEVRDPGRDASDQPQLIRWRTYEVLPGDGADRLLSLTGAHPTARIVRDPDEVAAAQQRLDPAG